MKGSPRTLVTLAVLAILTVLAAAPAAAQTCSASDADLIFEAMSAIADADVGMEAALFNKLYDALGSLANDDSEGAVAALEAFISKVEQQSGNQIDPALADQLIATAQIILNAALCPCAATWAEFLPAKSCYHGYYLSGDGGAFLECQYGGLGELFTFAAVNTEGEMACVYSDTANPSAFIYEEGLDADAAAACVALADGYIPGFGCPQGTDDYCI